MRDTGRAAYKSTMRILGRSEKLSSFSLPILFLSCGICPDRRRTESAISPPHYRTRNLTRALELLRPALQGSPGNAQLWTMQGVAYAGEGHKKEALTSFHNALKISPDYLPALQGRDPDRVSRAAAPRRFRFYSACCASGPAIPPVMPCWRCWSTSRGTVLPRSVILKRPVHSLTPSSKACTPTPRAW